MVLTKYCQRTENSRIYELHPEIIVLLSDHVLSLFLSFT
jgi:hypothetical protein